MANRLSDLAKMVGGDVVGDATVEISGAAVLHEAAAGDITLIDSADRAGALANATAAAVIVPRGTNVAPDVAAKCALVRVDDVHEAFTRIVTHFRPPRELTASGISPHATIDPSAQIGAGTIIRGGAVIEEDVVLGECCIIGPGVHVMAGCKLGNDVTLDAGVVLYPETRIGHRCQLHAGVVIGCFGFGYKHVSGRHVRTAQLGNVVIHDDVEIGANTTIDRGTYGATVIGEGTKIDNLVMIGHNCRIGRHNMLCSQVGIAGSTTTGDYVVMAGQVGVRDHVHIGTGAVLGAMAGVSNDVAAGERVIGIPATPERDQKLKQAAFSKLPEMRRQLRQMQRALDQLATAGRPPREDAA
ncbi:MAG: UDP-3-O-(3-hydroxymyristoyl)glucosamine N-acyltransferase [Planctomycetales bacterium]|nr:UDP-3-O-(3-hydroxymyristoyl)glucosamine N-acyltransferase [Planctomycetales bacterium]